MKSITVKRGKKKKKNHTPPTHEERRLAEMFAEESVETVDLDINYSPKEEIETFEFIDYGLDKEDTRKLWETHGEKLSGLFHDEVIKAMSSFDALKTVEEHISKALDIPPTPLLTAQLKEEITNLLHLKYVHIMATYFGLPKDLISKFLDKKLAARQFMSELLKTGSEKNPYGNTPSSMAARRTE